MTDDVREKLATQVGEYVTAHRKTSRLSVNELAERLGVSRQTVYMVEAGRQLPTWSLLYKLAEAFNVEPSGLLPTRKELL